MAGSSKKGAAWSWRRLALGAVCVGGLGAAGYVGSLFLPRATAQSAAPTKAATPAPAQPATAATPSDYSTRPVAFLHGNETITREQLGEYLIARLRRRQAAAAGQQTHHRRSLQGQGHRRDARRGRGVLRPGPRRHGRPHRENVRRKRPQAV